MTDIEALAARAQQFKALKQSPAWQELRKALTEERERRARILVTELLAGNQFDQSDIDYLRGFIDGGEFVLENPEKVETRLESALRRERNTN